MVIFKCDWLFLSSLHHVDRCFNLFTHIMQLHHSNINWLMHGLPNFPRTHQCRYIFTFKIISFGCSCHYNFRWQKSWYCGFHCCIWFFLGDLPEQKHYRFLTALCSTLNHTDQILYCIWFQNTCNTQQQLSLQVVRMLFALPTETSHPVFSCYLCGE